MKASELRIGNLIYDTKGQLNIVTIEALKYLVDYEGIHQAKPIPITEEWLLKLGFKKVDMNIYLKEEFKKPDNFRYECDCIFWENGYIYIDEYEGRMQAIKYIHQLQNLYFALTGEELEVNGL